MGYSSSQEEVNALTTATGPNMQAVFTIQRIPMHVYPDACRDLMALRQSSFRGKA